MKSVSLRSLLRPLDESSVGAVYSAWTPTANRPPRRADVLVALVQAMSDEERVEERLKTLPKKLADLLEAFLSNGARVRSVGDLLRDVGAVFPGRLELEAAVAALQREGFVFPAANGTANGTTEFAVPGELVDCIRTMRRRQEREVENTVTLRGFLNTRYFDRRQREGDPDERADDHARKVYKLYLMESSIASRVNRLPPAVRRTWDAALTRFGGIAPVDELQAALEDEGCDLDLCKKCLEETMLGTVAPLRLARFGLRPHRQTLIVFHEIALQWLQRHSDEHPVTVEEVLPGGVEMVANVGRFLRELDRSKVQFTVDGNLYKATEKRLAKSLLALPGGFLEEGAQLRFVYRFCLARRLLDRSGERALRPTEAGRRFDQLPLQDKVKAMVSFAVEERGQAGEDFHQVRLRRVLLRLLRRLEHDQWYELPFVPFLARNGYLSRLDESGADRFFATRFQVGGYVPSESLHQLAWQLIGFVKRRLFPLGLIDLGLRGGRPVAMRLSKLGAELLGAVPAGEVGGNRSQVVVNPDFEVLLFPGDDEHEVVHTFDRFAERRKSDHVYHFELSRDSLLAALREGMSAAEVVRELTDRSRVPLPQNVLYSLEDWADAAGVLVVDGCDVRTRKPDQLERFVALPAIRDLISERCSDTAVRLREPIDAATLRSLVEDAGFLVEERG